jgi:adenylate cyclase
MTQDGFKRKLTAILSADVKGYSLLMADDEFHTIQTLKTYRRLMSDLIGQHSGRVVDNPGDNLLAEFSSAVDAVECAVQIQGMLKKENAKFVANKRLQFRIGINIGDVVQDGDRIYGSGVNVAARIEGLAEPTGICISRNTYDHVKDKLDLGFDYLGEHEVKNIKEPVRVYKVLLDADSQKPLFDEQLELPDKPSIAVLPFDNMSGNPNQEYFSDGLTEQIINGLCKVSNLFVIGRNSSFAYKGKSITTKQIAKELGVRYILEGSVQRAGGRVRITAQLIDATTDYHMWSENYDRDLEEIFALQDEITMNLINAMEVNLIWGEQARLWTNRTKSIEAYDRFMRGVECFYNFTKNDFDQAELFFNEAINIDKSFAFPYVMLGTTLFLKIFYGWCESVIETFERVQTSAEKALDLDESFDMAHILAAYVYVLKRQYEEAIKEGQRAIELNPNGAESLSNLGAILNFSGKPDLAIELLNRAIRLNPITPPNYYTFLGIAYQIIKQYEKTIELVKKCHIISPGHFHAYLLSAASYSFLNRKEEAQNAAKQILRIDPNFSVNHYGLMLPYKDQDYLNSYLDALRKAGLPD